MSDKFCEEDSTDNRNKLGRTVGESQCTSRESLSQLCMKKANELMREAARLEKLAKLCAILPDEIENTFYPIIVDHLYNRNRIRD